MYCVYVCLSVCVFVISERLNQDNGKRYETGFFGIVPKRSDEAK